MRLASTNLWEFDLPNGAILTVTEHSAADWLDGLINDNDRIEPFELRLPSGLRG